MTVRTSPEPPRAGPGDMVDLDEAADAPGGAVEPALVPDPLGTDPTEAAAVRAGWLLVDAHERLGVQGAARVFGHELQAWHRYATGALPDLEPWAAGVPAIATGRRPGGRLRLRRLLDFSRPADRVLDVGPGPGLLCGLLLKDTGVAAYRGVDTVPGHLEATRDMLAANRLAGADVELGPGGRHDLDPAWVAAHGTTLMMCCDVLEHVPDPEAALRAMSAALPDGADLLLTVALHGRLEAEWGHGTVFDVARLKGMIRGAGLVVHHVEPVANTWALVVASRDLGPSARVRSAPSRAPVDVSRPLADQRDFVAVPTASISSSRRWVRRADCLVSPLDRRYMLCAISGQAPDPDNPGGQYGGVTFPVKGLSALRFELEFRDFTRVRRVYVDVHHRDRRVGRWTWKPTPGELERASKRRFALRPGESSAQFVMEEFDAAAVADRVEIFVQVKEATHAAFAIRAAYLP